MSPEQSDMVMSDRSQTLWHLSVSLDCKWWLRLSQTLASKLINTVHPGDFPASKASLSQIKPTRASEINHSIFVKMPNSQSSQNGNGRNDRKDFEQPKPDQEGRDTSINAKDSDTTKKEAMKDIHADTEDLAKVMYGTQSFGVWNQSCVAEEGYCGVDIVMEHATESCWWLSCCCGEGETYCLLY